MENGLTYYLIKNSAIKGYADFTLVQKLGMALQDSTNVGMVYLMNTMALTDTRNFPNGEIFTFIDNMGLDLKNDLSVEMEDRSMAFTCRNVPLNKNNLIVDSMLLALCNIAYDVSIDDASVERGKSFLKNIFSSHQDLSQRVEDSLRRSLYAGSEYAYPTIDEVFSSIDNYTTDDVRKFFSEFCRPELQAIVIAGDIDVAAVETKLRALFQTLPKSRRPNSVSYSPYPSFVGEQVYYFEDKEAISTDLNFRFFTAEHNPQLRNTAVPYVYEYMLSLAEYIIEQRLKREVANEPFYPKNLEVGRDRYLGLNSMYIDLECTPEEYVDAYKFVVSQLERLIGDGSTEDEYQRAFQRYYQHLQYLYDKRESIDNSYYTTLCTNNFISGYSMNGVELYKSYIDVVKESVTKEEVDNFISLLLRDTKNRLLYCISPDYISPLDGVEIPVLPPFDVDSLLELPKLEEKRGAKIRSEISSMFAPDEDIVSRRLRNGVNVAYKKMTQRPAWIEFEAVARGGLSLVDEHHYYLAPYIGDMVRVLKTAGYNCYELEELQRGSFIELERVISLGETKLKGRFHKDRLEDFLRIVQLYFKEVSPDEETFEKYLKMKLSTQRFESNSPQERFRSGAGSNIFVNNSEVEQSDTPDISLSDYYFLVNFINELYSNPAAFSFNFVGDIPESEFFRTVRKYIGELPAEKILRRKDESHEISVTSFDKVVYEQMVMEFQRGLHSCKLMFPNDMQLNKRAVAEVASKVIMRHVIRQLSLEGLVVGSDLKFYRYPKEVVVLEFTFSTFEKFDSELLENRFAEIIQQLSREGVSPNEVESVKKNLVTRTSFNQENSFEYWMSMLKYRYVSQKDFYSGRVDAINSVTAVQVESLLDEILTTGNITLYSIVAQDGSDDNN